MKTKYKKSFWGSIVALFLGTSCCWISTLVAWLGGAALLGTMAVYVEYLQVILIALGIVLGVWTIILYLRR